MTKSDIDKQLAKMDAKQKPKIKITDETRQIAGYTCRKANVTLIDKDAKESNFDVWFTKDIAAPNSMKSGLYLEMIDGFLMEFQTTMNSLTMKMSCRFAEETLVPDSLFNIPAGYTVTTMDELKNSMGGAH